MQPTLNILVFAYVFPPDAGSGTYRTLYFTNQWAKLGDKVTIVTVKQECFSESALIDQSLCKAVDPSVRIIRATAKRPLLALLMIKNKLLLHKSLIKEVNSIHMSVAPKKLETSVFFISKIKNTITDLLSCPDEHVGWVPDAVRQAGNIAKSMPIDCIYATGGPWSAFLAALLLHTKYSIPMILDFRDPWISNPNLKFKSSLSQWIQQKIEAACIKEASIVVANTQELRDDFITRYPEKRPDQFIAITNGFEDDIEIIENDYSEFKIVHAGAFYQSRNPIKFLSALAELVSEGKIPIEILKIQMIGWTASSDLLMESITNFEKLSASLQMMPRVTHEEALFFQQHASVLLLIQTGFPLQVPRKLYEYLALARPILAISECDSATSKIVNELRTGYVVADNVNEIKQAVIKLYRNWKSGAKFDRDEQALHQYSNRYLAGRLRFAMQSVVALKDV